MTRDCGFFELSNPYRKKIVTLIKTNPMKHSGIKKNLKIAPAEITRHLKRLTSHNIIDKKDDSRYEITPYGSVLLRQLKYIEIVEQNKKFFNTRKFTTIPNELLSAEILFKSEIISGPFKIFEKMYQITVEANDILYSMIQSPTNPFIREHSHKLSNGLELNLLFQNNVMLPREYLDMKSMSIEIRNLPEINMNIIQSEKEALVIMMNVNGKHDFSYALAGSDPSFRRWGSYLFEQFWRSGEEVIL